MKKVMIGMVALASLAGSGCLSSRVLKTVIQASDKNVTLVQTMDTYSFIVWPLKVRHQFWKCTESTGAIACNKACSGPGVDLTCPEATVAGGASAGGNAVR